MSAPTGSGGGSGVPTGSGGSRGGAPSGGGASRGALIEPSDLERGRRAYRVRRSRQSTLVALASTLVVGTAIAVIVGNAPGWPRTRDTFFDVGYGLEVLPAIARGMLVNLQVLAVAALAVPLIGLALALLRTLRGPVWFPVRLLATTYVDVFRGIPLLVLLFLVGLGIPSLRLEGVTNDAVVLGGTAVVLTYSAYVAEVFRAGIEGVHPSQRLAARSLGLDYGRTMRLVVLPQAVRRVAPPLLNDFVALQKDVGLISVLGATDAVRQAQIETAQTFDFTPYVVAAMLFVLLSVPTARLADLASARAARREQSGALL